MHDSHTSHLFFQIPMNFDLFFFVADVDVSQKCAQMFMKMAKGDTLIATLCNDGTVHLLHLSCHRNCIVKYVV